MIDLSFSFTIKANFNPSKYLSYGDVFTINAIGLTFMILSIKSKLTYMLSENYHANNNHIKEIAYPVVVFVNRTCSWSIFFIISVLIQLVGLFEYFEPNKSDFIRASFLSSCFGLFAIFYYYGRFLVEPRLREYRIFRLWNEISR